MLLTRIRFAAALKQICKEYHDRVMGLEGKKYDLEFDVRLKDFQVPSVWWG